VVLAVAGSSPVGHPARNRWHVRCSTTASMINPAVVESVNAGEASSGFWWRLLTDEQLRDCDDLEKIVIGCELIAALDAVDLLAA